MNAAPGDDRLQDRLRLIRALFMDVDGVLTDGTITYGPGGWEIKSFNVKDGYGLRKARGEGLILGIITGRSSEAVSQRAKELGITEVHQNVHDKLGVLSALLGKYDLRPEEIAYIGDDEPDLPLFHVVGCAFAPADADLLVRRAAHVVTQAEGGRGAVREVVELLVAARAGMKTG